MRNRFDTRSLWEQGGHRWEVSALHHIYVGLKSQSAATSNLRKSLAIVYLVFVVAIVKSIDCVLRSDRPL
ncbi:hypothetical protein Osc7112_2030 [Oscillatoria nigro-viridis PCC 7112]|uniref:Uncharacterized protein n=1 Tax=Phormidium nigroviride PCC 7112 TaxID=179408 RepID=K9VG89_9CYAN|nr:hypothetical protein Osc7112_2030 [Oscillatoria nigro-viridis PCC 7112]